MRKPVEIQACTV